MTKLTIGFVLLAVCVLQLAMGLPKPETSIKHTHEASFQLEREFVCPYPFGNYPIPSQCTSDFYSCSDGTASLLACTNGAIFDPVTYECTPSEQASCSKPFDCTNKEGIFPYPTDCAQFYYICSAGQSYTEFCPENYVFDPIENRCVSIETASCTPGPTTTTTTTTPTTTIMTTDRITTTTTTELTTETTKSSRGPPTDDVRKALKLKF